MMNLIQRHGISWDLSKGSHRAMLQAIASGGATGGVSTSSQGMSYLIDEVVSGVTFETFYEEAFMMPSLYSVRGSGKRRERLASFAGLTEYEVKNEGAEASTDNNENAYEKDFVHVAYAKKVPVHRELIDDEEFGLLADIGRQLGVMAAYTMERKAAQLFLDATVGATYKAEDDAAICSAHTAKDGTTITNNGTSALSLTAIKTTRTAMRKFTNHRGDLLSIRPNALLVAPDNEEKAWEIVRSTGKPETAENEANFYNGRFHLFVWDFLSAAFADGDDDQWFMLDTRNLMSNLIWFMRVGLEVFGDGNLFAGTRNVGGYFRASHGIRDYRGIYCHKPA